jgi:peroxiredoxin
MTIQVGDTLPEATLREFIEVEGNGCTVGVNAFKVSDLVKGKRVVIFAVPGAFTPTCSEQHLPGFVAQADALRAKGIDEIWCLSVNDAFVMQAWGRSQQVGGKIRMLADGAGEFTGKIGLELDRVAAGLGVRSQRYAMVVDSGVVRQLFVEASGKFEVSRAEHVLAQL